MAFNTRSSAAARDNNEDWKASGFLNFYLPNKEGGRTKVGAIPLRGSKPNEQSLFEWLKGDEARLQTLVNKLEVEFRTAESSPGKGFALD